MNKWKIFSKISLENTQVFVRYVFITLLISILLIDYIISHEFSSWIIKLCEGRVLCADSTTEGANRNDACDGGFYWIIPQLDEIANLRSPPSSDRHWFPLEEPTDSRILDSFGDFITRGWRGKKGKMHTERARPIGQEKFSTCFMLPSCPHPQLFGSSSVSSDLIVLLSSSLHPATRFSLYLLAWNFPLFEIERIVGGSHKKEWPIEYATASHRDAIVRRSFARDAFEFFVEIRFFFFSSFLEVARHFVGEYVV